MARHGVAAALLRAAWASYYAATYFGHRSIGAGAVKAQQRLRWGHPQPVRQSRRKCGSRAVRPPKGGFRFRRSPCGRCTEAAGVAHMRWAHWHRVASVRAATMRVASLRVALLHRCVLHLCVLHRCIFACCIVACCGLVGVSGTDRPRHALAADRTHRNQARLFHHLARLQWSQMSPRPT
jgi:hypothetical protein